MLIVMNKTLYRTISIKLFRFAASILLITGSILLCSCDTENTDTIINPRKFSWKIDSLTNPKTDQSLRHDIWGSSIFDLYTVGDVDGGGGQMWHFDGEKWESTPLHVNYGGTLTFPFGLWAIEGFSEKNIFAVGDKYPNYPEFNSLVIKFNGIDWEEVLTPDIGIVGNLFISSANNMYAGGIGKEYLHYDGINWTKDSINIITPANAIMHITDFGEYNNEIYCLFDYHNLDATLAVHYFLKKNSNGWSIVDSFVIDQSHFTFKWGQHLKVLPDGELYNFGSSELQKFDGNSWVTILNERHILDVFGPNSSNMFAVGYPGKAFHFNGTDWYKISQLDNPLLEYAGVWFNGKEAFICGNTMDYPQKSIVWHGKK